MASTDKPLAIISAVGSRGDVNPMVAIGYELKQRGFDVVVSMAEVYCDVAESAGLIAEPMIARDEFEQLIADPLMWKPLNGAKRILQGAVSRFLRPHWQLIQRYHRPGRTVLVQHPLDFASRIYRDFDPQTPLVSVQLSPAMVRDAVHPPRLTPWWFEPRQPAWLMRAAYAAADHLIADRWLLPSINPLRREVGLAPIRRAMDRWWMSPDQVLGMFPKWFGDSKPYIDEQWIACGFPSMDDLDASRHQPVSDEAMKRFDDAIVFTPGTAQHHAARWFEWAAEATVGLQRPVIFAASDQAQLPAVLPPHVQAVGYIQFKVALPRCSLLVHHGGVGTTGAALRAGCPQLICPSAFDQFHHADVVTQLGVGKAMRSGPTLKPEMTATAFSDLLMRLLEDAAIKQAAMDRAKYASDYQGQRVAADRISSLV